MKEFKDFRPLKEDTFDKSKEKNVNQIIQKSTQISIHINNLIKLDKQGEGKGELAKDLKALHKGLFDMNKAVSKIVNRLV